MTKSKDPNAYRPVPVTEPATFLSSEFTAVENVDTDYRFEAIGCVPVPVRSSIVRVVVFKLLGTGVFAALMACSTADPGAAKSCALAAAVNVVAVVHYWAIWRIRLQSFSAGPVAQWMVGTGRHLKEPFEVVANSKKLYLQEVAVDSLRSSDWTVTVSARPPSRAPSLAASRPRSLRVCSSC